MSLLAREEGADRRVRVRASGASTLGTYPAGRGNLRENAVQIAEHPLVREPHHAVAAQVQHLRALGVSCACPQVHRPVQFDHEGLRDAAEIGHQSTNGVLPPEPEPKLLAAQAFPEQCFRLAAFSPLLPRELARA